MEGFLHKKKDLETARSERERLKEAGKKVAFTNGCFDILHPGHTRYLYRARQLGDHLVVAVNSDRSVTAIKGPGRPVLPEDARAELLCALEAVDTVVIFDEETPLEVIRELLPDVLVKGSDWPEDRIVGAREVLEAGGEVKRIPFVKGFSTSAILERILGLQGGRDGTQP